MFWQVCPGVLPKCSKPNTFKRLTTQETSSGSAEDCKQIASMVGWANKLKLILLINDEKISNITLLFFICLEGSGPHLLILSDPWISASTNQMDPWGRTIDLWCHKGGQNSANPKIGRGDFWPSHIHENSKNTETMRWRIESVVTVATSTSCSVVPYLKH